MCPSIYLVCPSYYCSYTKVENIKTIEKMSHIKEQIVFLNHFKLLWHANTNAFWLRTVLLWFGTSTLHLMNQYLLETFWVKFLLIDIPWKRWPDFVLVFSSFVFSNSVNFTGLPLKEMCSKWHGCVYVSYSSSQGDNLTLQAGVRSWE